MKTITLKPHLVHTGNLILVNARYPYRNDINRQQIAPVNKDVPDILMDSHAVKLLSHLMTQLHGWDQISAVSGWRSMEEQTEIYNNSLLENGKDFTEQFVALPGRSEHQTGLAIDLGKKQEQIDFIRPDFPYTGICQTFRELALSYGFVERYPFGRESDTGIAHEPWHFRYVGHPHSLIMKKHDFVLEDYISFLRDFPFGISSYRYTDTASCIHVSYLKAEKSADTKFEIDDTKPYSISGNNVDGFIITQWRD